MIVAQVSEIRNLIKTFRISKPVIAQRIGMAESTFKIKLSEQHPNYNFEKEEFEKLKSVIQELKEMAEKSLVA